MLCISWINRVSNAEVLVRMNTAPEIIPTVKRRKLEYFWHVTRGEKYRFLQLIMQRKIEGRRRTSCLKNLRDWYLKSTRLLLRAAVNKVKIAIMVANHC
ncbi:endonuclease-reverse transcriptase [Lasius niger]|uniref:Endonuclease-reverse transcriptase n=1 Tax=Lasius niger TaxID=67767 RepID=A0A0J7KK86_LASNI|nr:endonuclease-reverse transcriptase [Lasius niger]